MGVLKKGECMRIPYRNAEGYADPTASAALNAAQGEQDDADIRAKRLISAMKAMVELADFGLLARIEVIDNRTGRIYR